MKIHTIKRWTTLAFTVLIITGCSQDKETPEVKDEPVAVNFAAGIVQAADPVNAISRASGSSWNTGDRIGVYMVENGATTVKDGAENRLYTTSSGNGTFTANSGHEIIYPQDTDEKVDFIAYYPYSSTVADFIYPVDITDQSSAAAIDLMYAQTATVQPGGYNKTTPTVNLAFDHMLTRFIIKTVAGRGLSDLRGMTVSIHGMNTEASFDLETGALTNPTATATIDPLTLIDGAHYEAILLPTTSMNGKSVVFALNGDTYVWDIPSTLRLQSGYEYTYTITVQKSPVVLSATIVPWKDGGSDGTGTAK